MSLVLDNDIQQSLREAPMTEPAISQPDGPVWDGGVHDQFCFICGDSDKIVGCRTCARCYHTQCMFPPLERSQLPDPWFCPVCVGRTWHIPHTAPQEQPPVQFDASILANTSGDSRLDNAAIFDVGKDRRLINHLSNDHTSVTENQNQRRKEAQRWKENSWYTPRGYILDPSSADSFIPLDGNGPSISFTSVMENRCAPLDRVQSSEEADRHVQTESTAPVTVSSATQRKSRGTKERRHDKSPPRKRSKYSSLPADLEQALDLIKTHLETVSQARKIQDNVKSEVQVLQQKLKIQEGELLFCRQELQATKHKLSAELLNTEKIMAELANSRKEAQELRDLAQTKEDQITNWQKMLRTMMGTEGGSSAG